MPSNEFYAGLINGFSQTIIAHPLDTIKTLQQNSVKFSEIKYKNLYKGFSYLLTYKLISKSLCFDFDAKLKNKYNCNNPWIRGGITGICISPIAHILDLYKVKRQNNLYVTYKDFINYKSFGLSLLRDTNAYSFYIGTYITLRNYDYNPLIAGGFSGIINWTLSYPLDVLRTRQMTYPEHTILQSYKIDTLWKGYTACIIRAVSTSAIGFYVFELSLNYLNSLSLK